MKRSKTRLTGREFFQRLFLVAHDFLKGLFDIIYEFFKRFFEVVAHFFKGLHLNPNTIYVLVFPLNLKSFLKIVSKKPLKRILFANIS